MLGGAASFPARRPRLRPCGPGERQPHVRRDGRGLLDPSAAEDSWIMAWSPLRTAGFWGVGLREARPGARLRGLPRDQLGSPGKPSGHRSGVWGEPAGAGQEAGGLGVSLCESSSVCPASPISVERPEGPD